MDQSFCYHFIILSVLLVYIECATFHISPSTNDTLCTSVYSCMTLSTAASLVIRPGLNLTLVLLPGSHTLNTSNFIAAGIPYFSMKSSSGHSNHTINCYLSSNFQFRFNTQIHMSGLSFNGCLENEVYEVDKFIMEDCILLGSEKLSGRALVVTRSTLTIMRSSFTSFYGSKLHKGGAIYCSQGNIHILNCTFTGNCAASGGALHTEQNSDITIEKSVFSNHKACYKESHNGGVIFVNMSLATLSSCVFRNNSFHRENLGINGGTLSTFGSNISILWCTFSENIASNGGAIYCHNGTFINISDTKFTYNTALNNGGVVYKLECAIQISRSNFSNNTAKLGGVLYATLSTDVLLLEDSNLYNNTADRGGVVYFSESVVNISRCHFGFNEASQHGGALFLTSGTNATIICSKFNNNKAVTIGGALRAMNDSKVFILQFATFQRNSAFYGAAIHLYRADQITFNGMISISDNIANLGILVIINSKISISRNVSFIDNVGSLFAFGSGVSIDGTVSFNGHSVKTPKNISNMLEKKEGGCITLLLSKLDIRGVVSLSHNVARNGGGILAISSNVNVLDSEVYILGSNATDTGGGVYLYQSKLYIRGTVNISNNRAKNYGGGIHAISSVIVLHSQRSNRVHLNLTSNTAELGGGACLEVNSKFFITQLIVFEHNGSLEAAKTVHLLDNTANLGGAIYVADGTNIGTCSSGQAQTITAVSQSECFFQIIAIGNDIYTFRDAFSFANNSANTSGSLLFGGLLDRCTVSAFSKNHVQYSSVHGFANGIVEDTSSHPVKMCTCSQNGTAICSHEAHAVKAKKGENFTLNVVAVDQVNHTINATINSYLKNNTGTLGGQKSFTIGFICTELSFIIMSPVNHEELVLYAEGPCKDLGTSPLKVRIDFIPCHCPMGFELSKSVQDRCLCVCHNKLLSLPFMTESDCNTTTLTIKRRKTFWISVTNATFIVYEQCPFDYCFPSTPPISIDLDIPGGADAQCNFNRSGMLCGSCQEGLTLSLGSSHCIECPTYWPALVFIVFVGAFLAGLALVALLLISNLTVAAGTLNGVIFYANVFSANQGLFMPFQHLNLQSVFIAWLNLDLGFDVCFIKNMDTYVKAWLQLLFPVYLIFIVIAVMIASKYSMKFAKIIAPKNPVATLATLILLSYAKLLDSIITALSFATLSYIPVSEGSQYEERVWLYDASVLYLRGKHVPLFIVAIFILLLGFSYTFLLLLWQWLVQLPDRAIFQWIRNTKLCCFIDAYHAPFTVRNRYWTGLLLLARVILYLTTAINISGKPSVNLLAVTLVIGFILLLQGYSGIGTYKKWMLNIFEFTSYFNILAFTVAKFYVLLTEGSHTAIAYISITVEIVLFLCIIIYHTTVEINIPYRIKHSKWYKGHFGQDLCAHLLSNQAHPPACNQLVTYSEISIDQEQKTETDHIEKEREDIALLLSGEQGI